MILLVMCLTLAGCKSSEERAEEHFKAAQALIASGDNERAIIELKNVFELVPAHREGRALIADIYRDLGDIRQAYANDLRLAEQYPDDLEARVALAEMAFEMRQWDEFVRHGGKAVELAPDDPRVKAISTGSRYRDAVTAEDATAREALVTEAGTLLAALPDSVILRSVLVDGKAQARDFTGALAEIDGLIALRPDNRDFHMQRLTFLASLEDDPAIEAQLKDMVARFPDDTSVKAMLVRYYLGRQDIDSAEAFLRSISDPAATPPGAFVDLIAFLARYRGPEAVRAEIERGIAASPDPVPFRLMRAGLDFEEGKRDAAVADLEAILKDAQPSDQTRNVKVTLARMLSAMGNQVGGRRLIEEVLAEDAGHVEALKLKAATQIQEDDADGALASLRIAADQAPQDSQVLTMMAEAYGRTGNHDLARESLARAVEASGNAPDESIAYARLLMSEERYQPAEDVLLPALKLAPGNLAILSVLGRLYITMDDIPRGTQVIDTLRRIGTPEAVTEADALQVLQLDRKGDPAEVIGFLESLAGQADADTNVKLALLRAKLSAGQTAEALAFAEKLVADNPGNSQFGLGLAATRMVAGDADGAVALYRELAGADPTLTQAWLQLSAAEQRRGQPEAARAAIDEGLAALPDDANLMWAKASFLEQDGDIDGAIALYETLYQRSPGSIVVANNLASLLVTYRDDEASLERAWTVARRLKGATAPALQDTYGWIAFRRGEVEEAMPYLEAAARALTDDPLVQLHLGLAYLKLDRKPEALAQLQRAVGIAGPEDARPQLVEARDRIAALQAEGVTAAAPPAPAPDGAANE